MKPDAIRGELTRRLNELIDREERLEDDIRHTREALEQDSEERAVQQENDEVLDALDQVTRGEIARIRHALARLDAGLYGKCETCNQDIAPARLQMLPQTTNCSHCAS